MNISAKTKIFSKIFKGVNLGSRYYGFMKKTRLRKSHATVPLKKSQQMLKLVGTRREKQSSRCKQVYCLNVFKKCVLSSQLNLKGQGHEI